MKFYEFAKFCIVGSLGVITNLVIFKISLGLNINIFLSSILAFIVALTQNYIFNHKFTFNVKDRLNIKRYILFAIFSTLTLSINLSILYLLKNAIDIFYAQICGIICSTAFNYIFSNLIVFRRKNEI